MTILPVVERELRVASRRPATYRLRSLAALAVIAFGFLILISARPSMPPHEVAKTLFAFGGSTAFAGCLLAGVWLTADCLSVERREGTLGLLFLTDLRSIDVVLGKLAATSLQSIYALLASFPMLGLPLLMGGVSSGEFFRLLIALLTTLVFSLAMGLLVSALVREAREAVLLTLGTVSVFAGLFPLLAWLGRIYFGSNSVLGWWFVPSPVGALMFAFDVFHRAGNGGWMFWLSVAFLSTAVLMALCVACAILPRTLREENRAGSGRRSEGSWHHRRFGSTRLRRARKARLELNPFYWLAVRDRLARILAWVAVGFLGSLWFVFFAGGVAAPAHSRRDDAWGISVFIAFALHIVFKIIVATEASRRLSEDSHNGALELLLTTPLSPMAIARGQWLAMRELFLRPMLTLSGINLLSFISVAFVSSLGMPAEVRAGFSLMFLGGILALLLDFFALSRVGLWMALRRSRHPRAVLGALGRIMLPSWVALLGFFFMGVVGGNVSNKTVTNLTGIWFVFGATISLLAGWHAGRRLRMDFRALAAGEAIAKRQRGVTAVRRGWQGEPAPRGGPA
jgi:hypothetical protein